MLLLAILVEVLTPGLLASCRNTLQRTALEFVSLASFGAAMTEQWVELQEGTWLYCWSWRCWLQTSRTHWVRLRDQDLEDIGGSVMLSHLRP